MVLEAGDDDLIAFAEVPAAPSLGDQVDAFSGAAGENNFVGVAGVDEVRGAFAGGFESFSGALAQGMMMPMDGYAYRSGKAATGYRAAAKPAPRVKRAKRSYYRSAVGPKTCGQFKYWSTGKGRCMDARTSPPALK